jgi:hypothetical protein
MLIIFLSFMSFVVCVCFIRALFVVLYYLCLSVVLFLLLVLRLLLAVLVNEHELNLKLFIPVCYDIN